MARRSRTEPTPLKVAGEAARAANRAARLAEDEAARQRAAEGELGPTTGVEDLPPGPEDLAVDDEIAALQEHLAELVAGEQAARLDVFLVRPLPAHIRRRQWLGALADFRSVGDLRAELVTICQAAGKSGDLELHLSPKVRAADGSWQYFRNDPVALWVPPGPQPAVPAAAAGPRNPFDDAKAAVELGRAVMPPAPVTDPVEILKSAVAMFRDLKPSESVSDKLLALLPAVLPALKDLFAPRPSAMDQAVAELVKQRLVGGEKGDLVDEVDKLRAMVDLMRPLLGAAGEEPKGAGVALIETLPEVVRHLAAPIDKLADAYRYRVRAGAPAAPGATAVPVMPPAVGALWQEVAVRAARTDDGYFPVLARRLRELIPGADGFLAGLTAGQVTHEQALAQFEQIGGDATPATRAYLVRFCNWLRWSRAAQTPPPAGPGPTITTAAPPAGNGAGAVLGRCERCQAEYQYDSEAVFAAEQGDPCESCGGLIRRVTERA